MADHPGQPLKFPSVDELQKKIDDYFRTCDERTCEKYVKDVGIVYLKDPAPYTVSGLACFLDTSRETLINYEEKEAYFDTIKRAKNRCLADSERRLYDDFTPGVIFSMKNNYGWKDNSEINHKNNDGKFDSSPPIIINCKDAETKKLLDDMVKDAV